MREATIEEIEVELPTQPSVAVERLRLPEEASQAELLTGSAAEIAERMIELLRARGLL
jgi:electron transfer flavoprotein beta subunit